MRVHRKSKARIQIPDRLQSNLIACYESPLEMFQSVQITIMRNCFKFHFKGLHFLRFIFAFLHFCNSDLTDQQTCPIKEGNCERFNACRKIEFEDSK